MGYVENNYYLLHFFLMLIHSQTHDYKENSSNEKSPILRMFLSHALFIFDMFFRNLFEHINMLLHCRIKKKIHTCVSHMRYLSFQLSFAC